MSRRHVAVIDIGKSNAKLALVDGARLAEIEVVTRPNEVQPGPPYPHFDVEGHWAFILDALSQFHVRHRVDAISITTHGAAAALIGADGKLAAPILDYEHDGPDQLAEDYEAIRPAFEETGSPRLAGGLNIGAQLYWQFQRDPTLRDRVRHIVTYPQYWGLRLTGVAATDVTSLGCHTDLWDPFKGRPSSLHASLGTGPLLAPTHRPEDVLGAILPAIADRTGLSRKTPVYAGIHDSNASLLAHVLSRKPPFSVVSTGTWVIAMAIGGTQVTLDPARDTLVNVNALGDPVPSARFMGGREYDLLSQGQDIEPTAKEISEVLRNRVMLLPSVVPETGPYQGMNARWIGDEPPPGSGERSACTGFYLGLMTAQCLDLIGHQGPVYVEGPFAKNNCILQMLSAVTGDPVFATESSTGTSQGAALLDPMVQDAPHADSAPVRITTELSALRGYAMNWHSKVTSNSPVG